MELNSLQALVDDGHVLSKLAQAILDGDHAGPGQAHLLTFHEPMSTNLIRSRLNLAAEIAPREAVRFVVNGVEVGGYVPNG